MTRAIAGLILLILLGCVQGEKVTPTREMESFTLHVVMLEPDEVVQTCIRLGAWPADEANAAAKHRHLGCAVARLDAKECTVYSPRPVTVDDQSTTVLGHEVLHCAFGRYHQ